MKSQTVYIILGFFLSWTVQASVLLPFDVDALEKQAREGNHKAQFELAVLYEKQGVKDYPQIVRWLRKSAEGGNMEAQFSLGKIYHFGKKDVPVDLQEAAHWYEKAAQQGDRNAYQNLLIVQKNPAYRLEREANSDEKWELEWLLKTASYGDSKSQLELGRIYAQGKKVPQDYARAIGWYEQAARNGVEEAMATLGYFYLQGKGVPSDTHNAVVWYEAAAQKDYHVAQRKLFEIYSSAEYGVQDFQKAYVWLYISLSFMFPTHTDLMQVSPELEKLDTLLTPVQKKQASMEIQNFIKEKRGYDIFG